ncbi:hypothetical protein J7E91_12355 [Streptomyces sp. ISL-99]|uniref:hypothetical protein n=1 Tax=Streptomyces sp. ISL-99 TaxID=2819193 RepID=UPI001BE8237F|nr:hypothetical protein [Streptomyces sp. ISL-99]MBT2526214.1 hypothetical protein [Streptomyces sp. ISL-99]
MKRMYLPRRFGRGRISAAAAAAVVIATPAAIAALPDAATSVWGAAAGPEAAKAPPEAGAPAPGTPIRAGLLKLDLGPALGLAGNGVAAAPVDGAVQLGAGGVGLKAREGSRIAHGGGKLRGGKVVFDGGVRLSKGDRAVVFVKDFAVYLRTHVVTATVGEGRPGTRLGVLKDARTTLIAHKVAGDANIATVGRLVLDAGARERIDAGLGADVLSRAAAAGIGTTFEAHTDLDVDLAFALGLDAELGLEPRRDSGPDPDMPPTPVN